MNEAKNGIQVYKIIEEYMLDKGIKNINLLLVAPKNL